MDTYIFRRQIHKLPGKVIHHVPMPVKESDYEELTRMVARDSINYSAPMTFSEEDIVKVLERVSER